MTITIDNYDKYCQSIRELTPEHYLQMVREGQVTFVPSEKIRLWGGWYRHTIVLLNGKEAGRIQLRRRNKRYDVLTIYEDACVLGSDPRWIVAQALGGIHYARDTM